MSKDVENKLDFKQKVMNKSELLLKLTESLGSFSAKDVKVSVACILEKITVHLADGGRVEIRGFGTFGTRRRPPKTGRNPKTGERVDVPEKIVAYFKSGDVLRKTLNKKP